MIASASGAVPAEIGPEAAACGHKRAAGKREGQLRPGRQTRGERAMAPAERQPAPKAGRRTATSADRTGQHSAQPLRSAGWVRSRQAPPPESPEWRGRASAARSGWPATSPAAAATRQPRPRTVSQARRTLAALARRGLRRMRARSKARVMPCAYAIADGPPRGRRPDEPIGAQAGPGRHRLSCGVISPPRSGKTLT